MEVRKKENNENKVTPEKTKTRIKVKIEEKVDKEIARVLMNLGTPSTIPIKKNMQEDIVTSTKKMRRNSLKFQWRNNTNRKMRTRSQASSKTQVQAPKQ